MFCSFCFQSVGCLECELSQCSNDEESCSDEPVLPDATSLALARRALSVALDYSGTAIEDDTEESKDEHDAATCE